MVGRHHPLQRVDEGTLWIGEEGRHTGERLLLLGIEDMEDCAHEQGVAGLLPMIAPLERTFGIHQDVRNVLDVANLLFAPPDLKQRIVLRGARVCRIEHQAIREAGAPAGSQRPILALDVVDNCGACPGEQSRHHEPDAFAAPGRRERHDVLGSIMPEVAGVKATQEHAGIFEKSGFGDLLGRCPSGGAVSRDVRGLPRPPDRSRYGCGAAGKPARARKHSRFVEHLRRIGFIMIPPGEERPGMVDRRVAEQKPGVSELRLIGQHRRRPLGCGPKAGDHDRDDDQDLADKELGWRHREVPRERRDDAASPESMSPIDADSLIALSYANVRSCLSQPHGRRL
jgi:hypothetical protein